jgi:hypothetical protein
MGQEDSDETEEESRVYKKQQNIMTLGDYTNELAKHRKEFSRKIDEQQTEHEKILKDKEARYTDLKAELGIERKSHLQTRKALNDLETV